MASRGLGFGLVIATLFAGGPASRAHADAVSLSPVGDGAYAAWTPASGTTHSALVDDSPTSCADTANDYVETGVTGQRDSYTLNVGGIPDGATITQVDVTVCYRSSSVLSPGGTFQTFYRLNGADADAGLDLVTLPANALATSAQLILVASVVKNGSTALEIGVLKTGTVANAFRVLAINAQVQYTPPPTNTPINTPTSTPTNTPPTPTPTNTPSATPVPTDTPTATASSTNTPAPTSTQTPSLTPTVTPTATPTGAATDPPTPTTIATPIGTPTSTPSSTATSTPTSTATTAPTNTATTTPTTTATSTPTASVAATTTAVPSLTPQLAPAIAVQPPLLISIRSMPARARPLTVTRTPTAEAIATPTSTLLPPPTAARIATTSASPTAAPLDPLPQDDGDKWLVILFPTQTYSLDMQPLSMAAPGERYRVHTIDGCYALGVWEGDVEPWFVWIAFDGSIAIFEAAHPQG